MPPDRTGRLTPAETITAAIIARLEAGTKPWVRPWGSVGVRRPLRCCGTPYRGMNIFWLWMSAEAGGFTSPFWMTYNQAQQLGAQVRKGERGTMSIFYKSYAGRADEEQDGDEAGAARRVLRAYTVFNASQCDGLPERFFPVLAPLPEPTAREAELLDFFARIPAVVRHGGDEACYLPTREEIRMPPRAAFRDADHYFATLAHELSHWTGHESRLARSFGARFGSQSYAVEELVAELSSAILGAELGLPVDHLDHHASYISSWLAILKTDSRAILSAAAKADEAAAYLLDIARSALAGNAGAENDARLAA